MPNYLEAALVNVPLQIQTPRRDQGLIVQSKGGFSVRSVNVPQKESPKSLRSEILGKICQKIVFDAGWSNANFHVFCGRKIVAGIFLSLTQGGGCELSFGWSA